MSESQSTRGGNSFDLVLRPKGTIDKFRRTASPHHIQDGTRTWLVELPVELIRLICRLLCLCSSCEPRLDPLDESPYDGDKRSNGIDSLSRACRFLCLVAQPYLFHEFGAYFNHPGTFLEHNHRLTNELFRGLRMRIRRMQTEIRRVTVNSIKGNLPLLRLLTQLRTLHVLATCCAHYPSAGGIRSESYLSFPCLHELCYGPSPDTWPIVPMQDARTDLRAILHAAPSLSHLRCQKLWHDSSLSPFILLKLPPCYITTLELHQCWLPHGTFIRFMANFPWLKNFRLKRTMLRHWIHPSGALEVMPYPKDGLGRLADASDVVTALNPCKKTLERLILDFGAIHEEDESFFRPLQPSIKICTNLRTMHLSQGTIGHLGWEPYADRDALTKLLPRFIEEFIITDFGENYERAVLELARQAVAGAFPSLKHVRVFSNNGWDSIMHGASFLDLVSGRDVPRLVEDRFDSHLLNIDPHQLQPEEGVLDEGDDDQVSEDSACETERRFYKQKDEWVEFGRRCLSDINLMAEIRGHVEELQVLGEEDSRIKLRIALSRVALRVKVRKLFSEANVKFECVKAIITSSDGRWHHIVHI